MYKRQPQRYTLFVLAVLGMLAAAYWYAKKLRACLPAVAACAVLAVGMGPVSYTHLAGSLQKHLP